MPRKILEFTPEIYDVSGDAMDCFRANRGLDNTVNDVLTPLMDWSFEGGGGHSLMQLATMARKWNEIYEL